MTLNQFFHYFFNAPPNAHYPDPHVPLAVLITQMVVRVLIGVFAILLAVPPLVWWERRLLGWMQQRQGPNRVGPFGLLQTIADGIKLLFKEDMNPANVDRVLFVMAPMIFLIPSLTTPGVIPWGPSRVWGAPAPNVNVGVLYLLAWSSLAVYGVVLAGWSSNNKYSLLGGLRSSAQIISYELGMGLAIISVVLLSGSLNMQDIVANQGFNHNLLGLPEWNVFKFFPMGALATLIYMITMLAETNRAPFDLPEAETELVAGYHTEYTSMKFATFFLGEYANMIVVSAICATLFFGGYNAPLYILDGSYLSMVLAGAGHPLLGAVVGALLPVLWFTLKVLAFLYFFIWIRATMPRLRYDMLMKFGWQGILPVALINIVLLAVGIVMGWVPALVAWVVIAWLAIMAYAASKRGQIFTTATRRNTTIGLYSSAQPFRAQFDHPGHGGQTLPPDAHIGGYPDASNEREANAADREAETVDAAMTSKKG